MAKKRRGVLVIVVIAGAAAVAVYLGQGFFYGAATIHKLLGENKELKQAITNLTTEEQIGYAKVVSQESRNGKPYMTLRFVETARDDKLRKILEKDYTIEGDIVYFDVLIVKFGDKMVADGREKALYLWRRVYGETMAPQDGFVIEQAGIEPQRYADLLRVLPIKQREVFWSGIWDLANDPERLKQYGVKAIYGNVVYSRLRPGLIYVFKISAAGQVYPEIVPDM